ncbi:MAG: sigma-70 family RNA polymerase sigma factor [Sedimentisphaerales bacterium]|nr:sigma-70 family RNA polymerase sigma factor [Sedimentisphaerales bacterium]
MRDRHKELLELLDKSGAGIYTLLARLTLREDVAEELIQELFLKLSNSRGFEKSNCREAYARKVAINLAFDWRRKIRKKLDSQEYAYEVVTNDGSPLSKIIKSEELEEMLNTLEQLNENSRQIIILRYIEQQSYEDIAEQTGKTTHQVRALCSKALTRLRDLMRTDNKNISAKET